MCNEEDIPCLKYRAISFSTIEQHSTPPSLNTVQSTEKMFTSYRVRYVILIPKLFHDEPPSFHLFAFVPQRLREFLLAPLRLLYLFPSAGIVPSWPSISLTFIPLFRDRRWRRYTLQISKYPTISKPTPKSTTAKNVNIPANEATWVRVRDGRDSDGSGWSSSQRLWPPATQTPTFHHFSPTFSITSYTQYVFVRTGW